MREQAVALLEDLRNAGMTNGDLLEHFIYYYLPAQEAFDGLIDKLAELDLEADELENFMNGEYQL